jgi:hypothetical protein
MKIHRRLMWTLVFIFFALVFTPTSARAKCSPGLVRYFERRAVPVSAPLPRYHSDQVSIKWFGHAYFRIFSHECV